MKSASVPRRRIGRSSRALLHLLARCPNMPTDVVADLLGLRRSVSAAQLLARLQQMGLVRTTSVAAGQLHGGPRLRVWSLTSRGMQLARALGVGRRTEDEQLLPYGAPKSRRRLAGVRTLPLLIVTYRLLANIATSGNRALRVVAWEYPWVRSVEVPGHGRSRHARFPAAAVLRPSSSGHDARATSVLLLPDVGTAPVGSFRPALTALVAVRREDSQKTSEEPLLVIATVNCAGSQDRASSWNSIVANVARRAGEPPLRVRIYADFQSVRGNHGTKPARITQVDQAFSLLARHPLLTPEQLAILLSTTFRRVADLLHLLVNRELIEPLDARPYVRDYANVAYQLTRRGHREAADGCSFQSQLLGGTTACSRAENSDADGSSATSCTRLEQTRSSWTWCGLRATSVPPVATTNSRNGGVPRHPPVAASDLMAMVAIAAAQIDSAFSSSSTGAPSGGQSTRRNSRPITAIGTRLPRATIAAFPRFWL